LQSDPVAIVDLRGLEPPEPLQRILEALPAATNEPLRFLLSREPFPLYGILKRDGFRYSVQREEAGVRLVIVRGDRIP
jgi:hypothetical protein